MAASTSASGCAKVGSSCPFCRRVANVLRRFVGEACAFLCEFPLAERAPRGGNDREHGRDQACELHDSANPVEGRRGVSEGYDSVVPRSAVGRIAHTHGSVDSPRSSWRRGHDCATLRRDGPVGTRSASRTRRSPSAPSPIRGSAQSSPRGRSREARRPRRRRDRTYRSVSGWSATPRTRAPLQAPRYRPRGLQP